MTGAAVRIKYCFKGSFGALKYSQKLDKLPDQRGKRECGSKAQNWASNRKHFLIEKNRKAPNKNFQSQKRVWRPKILKDFKFGNKLKDILFQIDFSLTRYFH